MTEFALVFAVMALVVSCGALVHARRSDTEKAIDHCLYLQENQMTDLDFPRCVIYFKANPE